MRIFITTAGTEPYHETQRQYFTALAATDEIGEHQLAGDMGEADAVLFVDLHQHPADVFLRVLRRHRAVRDHRRKVYVYDERDYPFVSFPGIYVSATPALACRHRLVGGPYPALPTSMRVERAHPDLLFSFSGARTHRVRDAVLGLRHPRSFLRDSTDINFFPWLNEAADSVRDAARQEYETVTSRSKFVLCPRGHSPSSFRLYETLRAGRVPVVISDDWLPPPRVDWDACAIRVAERDIAGIPSLLERLEPRWPEIAAAATQTFDEHFARSRLWHHYATSLAELEPSRSRRPWWAQRRVLRLGIREARGVAARLRHGNVGV